MECNKEEAIRAKEIAEKKMQNNDFAGARKIALKAQQLCHDLENISQMIMVCDVHCSAGNKLVGDETDWYGVLQIEQTSNEDTIKKQYRKFALQLHPDKNKFPGAETAFKLIVEAQRVLLDKGKRSLHDLKRKASVSRPTAPYQAQQMPTYTNVGTQNNFRSTFTGTNFQHHKVQPSISNCGPTFWTMCPFCTVRYQYYRKVINKSIICQTCNKPFVAYERGEQGIPMTTNWGQPAFCQQKDVPSQGTCKVDQAFKGNVPSQGACKVDQVFKGNVPSQGASKVEQVFKGNFTADNCETVFSQKTGCTSGFGKEKVNGKRGRKQVVESSESCNTESSSNSEVDVAVESGDFQGGEKFGRNTDQYPRRSSRRKQQVSYKENLSDDDLVSRPKRAKGDGSSCATVEENGYALREDVPKMDKQFGSAATVKEKLRESACVGESLSNVNKDTGKVSGKEIADKNGCEKSSEIRADDRKKSSEPIADCSPDSSSESAEDPELYDFPDQDFNDFDLDRKEGCFLVNQTWAIYDTLDAMPRYYARIRKVFSSGFKLRITWLEPDPDDEREIEWVNKGLPLSCGKFRHGSSENTDNRLMFSHLVSWEKGSRRDTYKIYPKKGQIWGLFKSWDFNWISDADTKRKYDYEFVEILSDYAEGVGTTVAYLAKVKGFASVFFRNSNKAMGSIQIPPGELFRFSHRVPSFKLTGEEKEGVLKGSFELDLASLPQNLEEISLPEILKAEAGGTHSNCSVGFSDKVKPVMESEGCTSTQQEEVKETRLEPEDDQLRDDVADGSAPSLSISEAIEIPEPEFFNFDAEKSKEKLQIGQIWSLYCDEDGLPKYYGEIVKIVSEPVFKLHLRWLESRSLPNNSIRWHDEGMPISCGRFKMKKSEFQNYTCTSSFSHQVIAERAGKNEYTILPRKGDVWALYRNWSPEIKCSDLENCEYDVVEILEANDLHIEVLFLEHVTGFNSVFKPQEEGSALTKISLGELLRFSHQIPAFKLTEEKDGILRGFWELDPAALPVHYFVL